MKNQLFLSFVHSFNEVPTHSVRSSGRFEVIGNHTDHNGGLCIAASCDLAIKGYLSPSDDNNVCLRSSGYKDVSFTLNDLSIKKEEIGSSNGLVKGVAAYFVNHGYKIGGFDLMSESSIFKGAGVSSSAAFESMVAQIFNVLYNDGKISKIELAKAGQYAENNYFGKKSGLLDQTAICFGNISFMDFKDFNNPKVETLDFPFIDLGFVIVNSGGSHAKMSNLYSSIPIDMKNAAQKLGKSVLRECSLEELIDNKDKLTESEYKRAYHFFEENERVLKLKEALKSKDKQLFLQMIKESFISSRDNLENMMVKSHYKGSPLEACDYAYKFLGDKGACKINGGGFAGSIIVCLPILDVYPFMSYMADKYGIENVAPIIINPLPPEVEKL